MKSIPRLIAINLIIALSGCGLTNQQIIATQSFGTATTTIGALGEEEFVNIRNSIIEMNKALVSIDSTKTADNLVFDNPTLAAPTAQRVAASKALKAYGELLVELVTDDQTENLEKAASDLVNNTSTALHKDPTEQQKAAIEKAIVGLGSFWVEHQKAQTTKEIVLAYSQPVNELAELLGKDFSIGNGAMGYLKAYEVTAQRLKTASMRFVNGGATYTYSERERAVQAFSLAELAISRAASLSQQATLSVDALKKANTELAEVISHKEYSTADIKGFAQQIQGLVNTYRVLTN